MKTTFTQSTAALFLLLLATALYSCKKDNKNPQSNKPDLMFTALTSTGTLQSYNANNVGMMPASISITGLQSGETLLAIDYRPATGQLYGLGSTSRIYTISSSGKATAIGTGPFTPSLSGSVAGFDFNPTVDRIRIVTNTGQNLRAHPETGAVAVVDGNINGVTGASISSVAYTNSKAGAGSTVLFDIDVTAKKLYKQDPPNAGTLVEVGALGFTGSVTESSFDISPSGIALASVGNGSTSSLYLVNMENGSTTSMGNFPNTVVGIAIPTEPVAYAVDESNNLMIFNPEKVEIITKAITGLHIGETVQGIDFRPANGQLYALGSTSRIYTINLSSGAAVQVGMSPLITLLSGTSFGFDFNPVVDRIRVISNTGQNLRLDPNTGLIAAVDGSLNPGTPSVSAGAYSSNFPGATTTVLFDIDFANDKLYKQDPPNAGGLVEVGNLGIDVQAANGFDIGGTSGMAYAVLTVGSATKLYTINTTTGMATVKSGVSFNTSVRGFAIGLGF